MTVKPSDHLSPQGLPASSSLEPMSTGSWWLTNGSLSVGHSSPLATSLYSMLSSPAGGHLSSIAMSSLTASSLPFGSATLMPNTFTSTPTPDTFSSLPSTVIFSMSSSASSNMSTGVASVDEPQQEERNIYIMPLFIQILWSFIFGAMVFVAAGGNIIVIWIVLTHKRMRTVTNYFLVNLSLADIMVSTLNVIFNFIYMLNSDWPFGGFYCKVNNFIAILSVAVSVFTLMAISIDRYLAIVHPLRPRMSRTMTLNIIVVIWIASTVLSSPNLIYSTTMAENYTNGDCRVICYLEWSDGPQTQSRMEYIYNIIILMVTYMLPMLSMSYTYFRVGQELWGSQSIGECTAKQMESIKSKRKIVKMMMIVVAIFGFSWLPYHVFFVATYNWPWLVNFKATQQIYLGIYWLAMSHSMLNPIILLLMNRRFRHYLARFLNFWPFNRMFACIAAAQQSLHTEAYNTAIVAYGPNHQHPRYTGTARFSCASEACTDMRVRFNGNGNITLQATSATDAPGITGSSATSPLQSRFALSREML